MEEKKQKKQKHPLSGRGLTIAIGLSLLAAAIAGRAITGASLKNPGAVLPQATTGGSGAPTGDSFTFPDPFAGLPTASPTIEAAPETPRTEPAPVFENNAPPLETTTAAPEEIRFSLPLGGAVGDDYSMGVPVFSDTMGDYRTHNGVDFTGQPGESVKTVAPGTVTAVKDDRMFGNCVTVDHGNGYVSTVCGLGDEGLIRQGAVLGEGDVIGVVGILPAEENEAPHIHLEIRKDGVLCDPLEILGLDEAED